MENKYNSEIFMILPETFNSPASTEFDKDGNFYISSPNIHNDFFIKAGLMEVPVAPTIGKIDKDNNFTTWYTFKKEDCEKNSGVVTPMGFVFGPDGNMYVADMQDWYGGISRLLRIVVKDGVAIKVEVVATGFKFPNGLVLKGNDIYMTDTTLKFEDGKQISGVYKINIDELNPNNPLVINPFISDTDCDPHLFVKFVSNGRLKFGANGIAFDGEGNLYTTIMEEGSVHKTTIDSNGKPIETKLFADGMVATDGMRWDARTNKLYVADLFDNAIYTVDMDGNLELLTKNGDGNGENGELVAPSEMIIRGKEVIVLNFNAHFDFPDMVNTTPSKPHTLSVIKID